LKAIILQEIEINFRTQNCQKMALKLIKRLILSIDGASNKLNSYVFRLHFKCEYIILKYNFFSLKQQKYFKALFCSIFFLSFFLKIHTRAPMTQKCQLQAPLNIIIQLPFLHNNADIMLSHTYSIDQGEIELKTFEKNHPRPLGGGERERRSRNWQ
jgi:hypothetical protein